MQNQNETGPDGVPRVLGTRDGCRVGEGWGHLKPAVGGWAGKVSWRSWSGALLFSALRKDGLCSP